MPDRVFHVARRRATLVFWTAIGGVLITFSVVAYALHLLMSARGHGTFAAQPVLAILGAALILYMQLVYPAVTRLSVNGTGLSLRTLPGRRVVRWADIGSIDSVSALTPSGRGGNVSGLRLRDHAGNTIFIVPDVFTLRREELAVLLRQYSKQGVLF